jgi:hypothetical protein
MPCTYTGTIEGDRALSASLALSEVTSMLCDTCKQVEKHGQLMWLSIETRKWWREHKKLDKLRKKNATKY